MTPFDPPLVRYLRALGAPDLDKGQAPAEPFVTLSRRPGAGGRTVASAFVQLEAEERHEGWRVFDEKAFRDVMREAKLETSCSLAEDEAYESGLSDYLLQLFGITSPQEAVMREAFRAMRELAKIGRTVFLGRAAVCATRDLGGVHVRLTASYESCVRRLMRRYGANEAEAKRLFADIDRSRRAFFRSHFRRDIDDPLLYDLVINTDQLEPPAAARLIADLVGVRRLV